MRVVQFMVGALVVAAGSVEAARPAQNPVREPRAKMQVAMTSVQHGDVQARSQGYQMGWRLGFAGARTGRYTDHRPTKGDPSADQFFYRGYEDGWAAGTSPTF